MTDMTSLNTAMVSAELGRAKATQNSSAKSAEDILAQTNGDRAKIRKVAEDFESVFIGQMLQHMWAGVETDPTFGGGHGEDMFRPMMIDEYGKQLAKAGGIGIADQLEAELLRMQEAK